jgi:hypothetical protein
MRYFATVALAGVLVSCVGALVFGERDLFSVTAAFAAVIFGLPLLELTVQFWLGPPAPDVVLEDEDRREWF